MAPTLRSAGIEHLYLFGSTARGEAGPNSDIDLLFEARKDARFGIMGMERIRLGIVDVLGTQVDFIERDGLRDFAQETAARDLVPVF
ncbi:MAG: nucleotidyltransferase domain-containing protein [Pseudomonadota bacterium]